MIRPTIFFRSVRYAWRGLRYAWTNEQNFRIQIIIALVVVFLMIFFRVRLIEAVALIGIITLVLILELVNTIFEKMVDMLKPRIHHYASIIKDMMASAVFIASLAALIVGVFIFYPYFRDLLSEFF